ncbi:MAG TPA: alpha-glucosidase [Candidatus Acidoferrum sp.]|nr:alpha-glucosidase [Candidatus Acidoferrum sp.]
MKTHRPRLLPRLLLLLGLSLCLGHSVCLIQQTARAVPLQNREKSNSADLWWKHTVIYEIYPRSFQDSNGDGVGDINGITSRLDYLHELGIGAIWITPMYPSPLVDFGYDVADYTAIDPLYGTIADFDRLVAEAKQRNIRVIMDFVPNHTSDQHPWFKESRSSRTNPKRDWYIWRDGKGPGRPPNDWQSWFGHSAWQFDLTTNQYYYHYFYVQQPDLNWRNPEVRKAMYDAMRFWLDRGVAGFRLDAVSRLFEDPKLRDDPILPGKNAYGDPNILHKYTDNFPEIHDVLREMRRVVDAYPGNPVLISEADEPDIKELTKMYGKGDEVQLPMDFQIADVNKLSAPEFRRLLDEVDHNSAHGQPMFFFSNHDQPRQWDRYGDGVHNDQIAKLMATLLLTTRQTPLMYYGEEIGMRTTPPARKEDVQDPIGKIGWPKEKGRDGERTPMQWDNSKDAGFSNADHTWLPIPPSAAQYNVSIESRDPNSILSFYKQLLAMRESQPALREGTYVSLDRDDPYVLAYLRKNSGAGDSVLVVLNMSSEPHIVNLNLASLGFHAGSARTLLSSPEMSRDETLAHLAIPPFGVFVGSVH